MPNLLIYKSPIGDYSVEFEWVDPDNGQPSQSLEAVLKFLEFAKSEFPVFTLPYDQLKALPSHSIRWDRANQNCMFFNQIAESCLAQLKNNEKEGLCSGSHKANRNLLEFIIRTSYFRTIKDARTLNKYRAFSPIVYGEVSFTSIELVLPDSGMSNGLSFVDLGSGVGQVVLQISALFDCECAYGIEKADIPHNYSIELAREFELLMRWFGKKYSPFKILKGDFMSDEYSSIINKCRFIFANNLTFGAKLNHDLGLKFLDLDTGTRIISTHSFVPTNFRLSSRTINDLGAIVDFKEIKLEKEGLVSWTSKPVSFYLHVVDHGLVAKNMDLLMTGRLSNSKRPIKHDARAPNEHLDHINVSHSGVTRIFEERATCSSVVDGVKPNGMLASELTPDQSPAACSAHSTTSRQTEIKPKSSKAKSNKKVDKPKSAASSGSVRTKTKARTRDRSRSISNISYRQVKMNVRNKSLDDNDQAVIRQVKSLRTSIQTNASGSVHPTKLLSKLDAGEMETQVAQTYFKPSELEPGLILSSEPQRNVPPQLVPVSASFDRHCHLYPCRVDGDCQASESGDVTKSDLIGMCSELHKRLNDLNMHFDKGCFEALTIVNMVSHREGCSMHDDASYLLGRTLATLKEQVETIRHCALNSTGRLLHQTPKTMDRQNGFCNTLSKNHGSPSCSSANGMTHTNGTWPTPFHSECVDNAQKT